MYQTIAQANIDLVVEDRKPRTADESVFDLNTVHITTDYGQVTVTVHGDRHKPAVITYHDVGLDYKGCFMGLLNYMGTNSVWSELCVYHITAPGQEDNASIWQNLEPFPTLEQMAEQVKSVCHYFDLKFVFGFGVGTGAHILLQFALSNPQMVRGLMLVSPSAKGAGWFTWLGSKVYNSMTSWTAENIKDYLIRRWFSPATLQNSVDLVQFHQQLLEHKRLENIVAFINADSLRADLTHALADVACKCFVITGRDSPLYQDSIDLYSALPSENQNALLELHNIAILATEEKPQVLAQPIELFFKGFGIFLPLPPPAVKINRDQLLSRSHVTQNAIMTPDVEPPSL